MQQAHKRARCAPIVPSHRAVPPSVRHPGMGVVVNTLLQYHRFQAYCMIGRVFHCLPLDSVAGAENQRCFAGRFLLHNIVTMYLHAF